MLDVDIHVMVHLPTSPFEVIRCVTLIRASIVTASPASPRLFILCTSACDVCSKFFPYRSEVLHYLSNWMWKYNSFFTTFFISDTAK